MSFSVTILGSSSALPTMDRYPTAHLVNHDERFFLIDCGEGAQIQLRRFRKRFGKINHIFISHLHGDHVFGLFGLISTFSLLGRKSELHIYAPARLEDFLKIHTEFFDHEMTYPIRFHPIQAKQSELIYEDAKLTVTTIPLKHRIPCTGFLFREKPKDRKVRKEKIAEYKLSLADILKVKEGQDLESEKYGVLLNDELTLPGPRARSYAFCTDTLCRDGIVDQIRNVDVLYHEATFRADDAKLAKDTYHSTSAQAATIAKKANAGKLIIGHFSSRYKEIESLLKEAKSIFPNTVLAQEGDDHIID